MRLIGELMGALNKNSILSAYEEMVARGDILSDVYQATIVDKLAKYTDVPSGRWKFWRKRVSPPNKGIYLYGDVGRGKSLLAGLFYEHCGIVHKKRMHFNALMKSLQDQLHLARCSNTQGFDQMAASIDTIIEGAELLYLDEIQVRDICEAVMLHRVFAALFSRKMLVFMTSNYHPRKLYEDGVQRELFVPAIELLEQQMDVIALQGPKDYRVIKGMKGDRKFYIGENSSKDLRKLFLEIINHQPTEKAIFTLDHRELIITETYNKTAWFSFEDLCGSINPLWTADYRKIAENFTVIFIDGIPVFDQYLQNEMHRFIVLIDELYEHGTKIFCSMAADINNLYVGKPAVDIRRAMSRLAEMGSALW
ncbi:cell division protein ZapE [Candidatus Anaplasma sp. TIGMIC]|uniref:cell division protein ZapE n=1 Tax=Candidatus Anaplasma sp. TIGMIC TaxID=3020713 RepID=UPI00232E458C|nr:cell division protein ZapE [Candidatus Anaplasma sp. TIGMIC]MDB1135204.1 cell division protein ZapE [Candidatus Anaplasma sp. TIGMIC]